MQKVLVSILHFNHPHQTFECLSSLNKLKVDDMNVEILVIDNGSKEELRLDKKEFGNLNLKLIINKENLGFSGGHNISFKYAVKENYDFVMILNNDTMVDKDLILELLKPFKDNNKIGVTVPKMYFTKGHEFHKEKYKVEELGRVIWYAGGITDWGNVISYHKGVDEVDRGQFDDQEETEFASGACMMIKIDILKKVGFFDDKYFLYYEDGDLNIRIKKAGFKIIYVPTAILWHNNAGSSGSGSTLQDYYISRNRMLYGMTYAPIRSKVHLIRESLRLLKSGRTWQKKGIRDFYLRRFGKGSYRG